MALCRNNGELEMSGAREISDQVDILLDIVGDRQSRNWRGLKDLKVFYSATCMVGWWLRRGKGGGRGWPSTRGQHLPLAGGEGGQGIQARAGVQGGFGGSGLHQ